MGAQHKDATGRLGGFVGVKQGYYTRCCRCMGGVWWFRAGSELWYRRPS